MFYDLNPLPRGTTGRCALCQGQLRRYIASRSGDDEGDPGYGTETIEACERCIVDALLDGLAPR